ncbi:MAG TPA: vitamin K epoxide reductase family protein [Pyrinomonadaceae bacterium]|nr:vitamin K epoxide reductase family protein [Pyrinomonadaceae bacterium]
MAEQEVPELETPGLRKLPLAAGVVALVGLADSVYLSVKHFTAEPVPCSLVEGCEKVLTSPYAEIAGVPIAAAGAAAYFIAFALAVLAAYGDGRMWKLFGGLATLMAGFSLWLIFLQAFVIGAFCQFCLISAATSLTLFLIFIASALAGRKTSLE